MTSQLIPIIVVIVVSFCFKSTRWIGLVGIAIISYFKPVACLVAGTVVGIIYCYWKFWRVKS
jgi:hypothetical protein